MHEKKESRRGGVRVEEKREEVKDRHGCYVDSGNKSFQRRSSLKK